MIFQIIFIIVPIWIIFFGGAEKLENTFIGYMSQGVAGEKSLYIKLSAWAVLFLGVYDFVF